MSHKFHEIIKSKKSKLYAFLIAAVATSAVLYIHNYVFIVLVEEENKRQATIIAEALKHDVENVINYYETLKAANNPDEAILQDTLDTIKQSATKASAPSFDIKSFQTESSDQVMALVWSGSATLDDWLHFYLEKREDTIECLKLAQESIHHTTNVFLDTKNGCARPRMQSLLWDYHQIVLNLAVFYNWPTAQTYYKREYSLTLLYAGQN